MAERLAVAYAREFRAVDFTAASAGTEAVIAQPMHRHAAVVLEGLGGDSSDFFARQLTPKVANGADLIITMTKAHREAVLNLCPRLLRRTFTLSEAGQLASQFHPASVGDLADLRPQVTAGDNADISDPMGQDTAVFESVGSQIAQRLLPIVRFCVRCA